MGGSFVRWVARSVGGAFYDGPLHKTTTRQIQDNHKTIHKTNHKTIPFYLTFRASALLKEKNFFFINTEFLSHGRFLQIMGENELSCGLSCGLSCDCLVFVL